MWLAKRPAPGCTPVIPVQKITKPASKSRVPLTVQKVSDAAKIPAERKPAIKHKPVSVTRWWRVAVVLLFYCLSVIHGFVLLLCVSAKAVFDVELWVWRVRHLSCHAECTFPHPALNYSVICCSGPKSSSPPEKSESSGGREEKAWGTAESPHINYSRYPSCPRHVNNTFSSVT